LSYGIHPFKDEVVCDVSPLDVCDVVLGQLYMWKFHVVYESQPRSVIITLGVQLYRILEVVLTIVPSKQCRKVISHTTKFVLFTICSKDAHKAKTTIVASTPSIEQKQIADIVYSPTMVPTQCPINPRDNRLVEQIQPCQQQVVTTFHMPSNANSPTRHASHQDLYSKNTFPSSMSTQCNGYHFFLMGED
jgi:hypothetical protein